MPSPRSPLALLLVLWIMATASQRVLAAPIAPAPVAWWRADGTATDAVGTADGTLVNGTTFAPGIAGQSFSLDGVDDYVLVADQPALDFGAGPMSMLAWIRTTVSGTDARILTKGGATGGYALYQLTFTGAGTVGAYVRDASQTKASVGSSTAVNDGAWHLVVGVRSSTTLSIYVDGVLEGTTASSSVGSTDNGGALTIGQFGGDNLFFPGLIDEVALYDRALTSAEILQAYVSGVSVPEPRTGELLALSAAGLVVACGFARR